MRRMVHLPFKLGQREKKLCFLDGNSNTISSCWLHFVEHSCTVSLILSASLSQLVSFSVGHSLGRVGVGEERLGRRRVFRA